VVIDLREDGGPALDGLLMWLNAQAAAAGRMSVLILIPAALIDIVTAQIADSGVAVLVDANDEEVDDALSRLLAPLPSHLADSHGEDGARRLGEEVGIIARSLSTAVPDEPEPAVAIDAPLVQAILRLRRLRGQHFVPALFADPAWDILLDLMAARLARRSVSASSLCIAAAVPATTALRWITQMTEQCLLVRHPDPRDGRRVFISLSEQTAAAMSGYLGAARRIVAPVG
jgi:hypothetical protein